MTERTDTDALSESPIRADASVADSAAIASAWLVRDSTLAYVVSIAPHPTRPHVYTAILENSPDWWSRLAVFGFQDGRLSDIARVEGAPDANAVESVRWVRLAGFDAPLLEVYDQTHNGNGSFYLFALEGGALHRLVRIYAVDAHEDGALPDMMSAKIRPDSTGAGRLHASYRDLDSDAHADVVLSGDVLIG